jgi:poly-gamma-glutamate synthesis protein (capsule biosynthesis protein)
VAESVSVIAVGDLVPSKRLFQNDAPASEGFGETVALLNSADVVFGDLEMPLSTQGYPREKLIAFRASPEITPDLKEAGFDVLALANNHSTDYGYEALFETIEGLDREGILHVGAGKNLAESIAPAIVEVKGRKIGFIAFTSLLPLGSTAGERRPGLAPIHVHVAYEVNPYYEMEEPGNQPRVKTWADETDLAAFTAAIKELRSQVDFLVVSAHWGFGAGEALADYQRPLGQALIDAGADAVFGNHVHAVHGIEVYKGKVILYSPGNFIAQQPREGLTGFALQVLDEMSTDGYAAWLDVAADGSYSVKLTPTVTDDQGLPIIAKGEAFDRIAERLTRLSAQLDSTVKVEGNQLVVDLA